MIDILYLVKDLDLHAWDRMLNSIRSLGRTSVPFNICVSDTSKIPLNKPNSEGVYENTSILGYPLKYTHETNTGLFNRSRTINTGFKNLVQSEPFIVMDIDIVVPDQFLENVLRKYEEKGQTYMNGWIAYLEKGHVSTWKYNILQDYPIIRDYHSGYFICNKHLFEKLNGFDEDYDGWGGEDEDFTVRASVLTRGNVHRLRGDSLMGFHQWHPERYAAERDSAKKNKARYFEKKALYEAGTVEVDRIKGLEDRRP